MTKRALIVVDVQRDFCEGGALAVPGGSVVAVRLAELLEGPDRRSYDVVVATQDWHAPLSADPSGNCGHFAVPPAAPDFTETWPVHCEAGTRGAELHPALEPIQFDLVVRKGQGVPAYSAFEGSVASWGRFRGANLLSVLRGLSVSRVDVCGLAFDYCVEATALDASRSGLITRVLMDYTAAVSLEGAVAVETLLPDAGVRLEGSLDIAPFA